MTKLFKGIFVAVLSLSLTACTKTQSKPQESVAPIASASPSPTSTTTANAQAETALQTDFNAMLDALVDHVFPGSAGSSLNAASQGATLLSWYVDNKAALTQTDLTNWLKAYSEKSDDPDTFKQQIEMVSNWIKGADTDANKGALNDAGYQGEVNWSTDDCTALASALTLN